MSMYRRFKAPDYIVYGLLAVGILSSVVHNPVPFIIPILVFGTIFLLYKFPPGRYHNRRSLKSKREAEMREKDKQRRKSNLHVIYGNKSHSDDEPPRYH